MEKIIELILKFMNFLIPKKSKKVIFKSTPDFSDNPLYLYKYFKKNKPNYELVWVVNDKESLNIMGNYGVDNAYYYKSFKGLINFFSSTILISSHLSFQNLKSNRQKSIELGHGIPFKRYMFRENRFSKAEEKDLRKRINNIDFLISTSDLTTQMLSASFNLDTRKIIDLGYPRTDCFKIKNVKNNLSKIFKMDLSTHKVIMFCPTFRISTTDSRVEGNPKSVIWGYDTEGNEKLENLLTNKKGVIIIKLHPFEEAHYLKEKITLPLNCHLLTNDLLQKNKLNLYDVLSETDGLITDYSSIFFDYLLLDKPILFNMYDVDNYKDNRGLNLSPLELWLPGPIIKSYDTLVEQIDKILNCRDEYKNDRKKSNDIFNRFQDNNSCERISNLVDRI